MMMRFFIFGILGILGSVVFTAAKGAALDRKFDFTGEASLLLFPVYGLIAIFYPLIAMHVGSLPWYGRGAVYMAAFYVVQYLVGIGFQRLGVCPWKYPPGGSLQGIVRVTDAPLWFAAGLIIEWLYPFIKSL